MCIFLYVLCFFVFFFVFVYDFFVHLCFCTFKFMWVELGGLSWVGWVGWVGLGGLVWVLRVFVCSWTCCCIVSADLLGGSLYRVSICSLCVSTFCLRVIRSSTEVWRIWFLDVSFSVVFTRASMVFSSCVILRAWSRRFCTRVELDSLSWLISKICLVCVS